MCGQYACAFSAGLAAVTDRAGKGPGGEPVVWRSGTGKLGRHARQGRLADTDAYAQSKLEITIWIRDRAKALSDGLAMIGGNPGSLLVSKMVKESFGVAGSDLNIGADILILAALGARCADASRFCSYNDSHGFANPHVATLDAAHSADMVETAKSLLNQDGHAAPCASFACNTRYGYDPSQQRRRVLEP